MDLAHFREGLHYYLVLAEKNQQSLAALLHLHPNVLSRKLNHTNNATFNRNEAKQLILVLAEWHSFSWRSEVAQLLEMLDFNPQDFFTEKEWQFPPLNRLEQIQPSVVPMGNHLGNKGFSARISNEVVPSRSLKPGSAIPNTRLPNNLPQTFSSFVGREGEIREVIELLDGADNHRVLTLTGAGGSGKTRLALAVAENLLSGSRFTGGIFFIALENVTNHSELINELTNSLSLKELSSQTELATLKTYLAKQPSLLVLDNFEQLIEAAPLLSELLKASSESKFLITSRIPLQLTVEREYQVAPVPLRPGNEQWH